MLVVKGGVQIETETLSNGSEAKLLRDKLGPATYLWVCMCGHVDVLFVAY